MSPPLYDVILTDQIAPGYDRQAVVAALVRLLGQDERQIADLIQSGNQTIKSNVDARTGQEYIRSLAHTGAICRLVPGRDPATPVAADGNPQTASDATDLNIRVISPRPQPADVAFAPIQANRITPAPGGIDVNRIDTPPIAYDAIALLAAYEDHEAEKIYVLIFQNGAKRPYQCDANRIVFNDFPDTKATSVIASLRLFFQMVARHHPALRVDPPTAGFLVGRPPAILEMDRVKYTTMLGKTLSTLTVKPVV